ncbi:hypothetical protein [Tahibacter soli]|uniref:Uncharacterized protein n=1 Tax=Tahibacter soli TaxID=2983605 RepID=A0A9X3YIH7_9GAMM|nr:hypothetical protein [Tahibacter soli]MDC8012257.1 hypothetical protein [Tahibacter soli]
MQNEERVTRMRKLITEAAHVPYEPQRLSVVRHAGECFPLEALSRRAMVKQVALASSRYGLQDDVDVFVALAGCASVGGLSTECLQSLTKWCAETMDRMAYDGYGIDAPPAL